MSDSVTLWSTANQIPLPTDSLGMNTEVNCHTLFQRIFPTQGSNPHLIMSPALQVGSLPPVLPGKPLFLKLAIEALPKDSVSIAWDLIRNRDFRLQPET